MLNGNGSTVFRMVYTGGIETARDFFIPAGVPLKFKATGSGFVVMSYEVL